MIARVSNDELGTAVLARAWPHSAYDTSLIQRDGGFQGIYVQHSDPLGDRHFCYATTRVPLDRG